MKQWKWQGLILIALIVLVTGCQTARSWNSGCPGPYSGVRFFGDQQNSLPWDGKLFFMMDLPFTAIADTLLLPASYFVEPTKPPGGWVEGCSWAK